MAEQSKHGYLVLADISGYTSFLAKVELEHAHEILTGLLEVIVDKFQSLLTISKLEGDAVFAYVDETKIPRGETLLELIENTYLAFRQRRDTSNRATTCTCKACQSMPSLELKFFVHHGNFIVQHVSGIQELVGSDVNLAHRLMKNHVFEHTGWKAYALFTRIAMDCMMLNLEDVHTQIESYEHLGDIETITVNLMPRYEAIIATQEFYISTEDADFSISHEFDIPQPELWQMLTSPEILNALANNKVTWSAFIRPKGRAGVGAVNHCAHGKGTLQTTIVDWRPFDYFTSHVVNGHQKWYELNEVKPLTDKNGSVFIWRWKADMGIPRWISKLMGKLMVQKIVREFIKQIESYAAVSHSAKESSV
ncbi:MAG TPA: DUF2652 domain-containing protein [Anaerolineales bacterium]